MRIPRVAIEGGKTAGWPIPESVKEAFTVFCKQVGSLAKDDCAGALFIWQYLPADVREWAKLGAKGIEPMTEVFWERFRDALDAHMKQHFLEYLRTGEQESSGIEQSIERFRDRALSVTDAEYDALPLAARTVIDGIRVLADSAMSDQARAVVEAAAVHAAKLREKTGQKRSARG